MAENINININAKDSASAAIERVKNNISGLSLAANTTQKNVAGLSSSFNGLKSVLSGLAIGSIATSALNLADSIVDLSNATNLSTQSILGFSQAIALNGGDMQSAQQALLRFTQTLGDAKNGITSAQRTFNNLGVSISELRTLSQQDILRQTVAGLGNIEDAARRSSAAVDIFGRSFASVDIASVNTQLDEFIGRAGTSAQAVEQAGNLQGRLNDALAVFQIELLRSFQPLIELASSITTNEDSIRSLTDWIYKLTVAITALWAGKKIITMFAALSSGMVTVAGNAKALHVIFGELALASSKLNVLKELSKMMSAADYATVLTMLGSYAAALIAIGSASYYATSQLYKFMSVSDELRGIADEFTRLNESIKTDTIDVLTSKLKDYTNQLDHTTMMLSDTTVLSDDYIQRLEAEKTNLGDLIVAIKNRINVLEEESKAQQTENEQLEQSTYLRERQARIVREGLQNFRQQSKATQDTIASLKEEIMLLGLNEKQQAIYNALKEAGTNATVAERAQISALAGELFDLTQARELDAAAAERQAEASAILQSSTDNLTTSYQDAIASIETLVKNKQSEYEYQNKINTSYGIQRDILEQMAEFDNERVANLERLRVAAEEAAAVGVQGAMDQYNAALAAYEEQRAIFEEQARVQAEIQNSFTQGWKEALANIGEQFTPFQMAQDAVMSGFNAMSTAMSNFVETGKLDFKDMARSIITDIGLMIAKMYMFEAIKSVFGLGGLSLPGRASGGPVASKQPYIVGERGPELFVPNSSGTIIPNNKLGAKEQPTQNITNVYNINAVDAKSVAQLFYENRKALLGTVNVAQKELPYGANG